MQDYVENNSLGREDVSDLVRVSDALIKDHNFKVCHPCHPPACEWGGNMEWLESFDPIFAQICQGSLQVLHAAVLQDGDAFKVHANALIPPTVSSVSSKQWLCCLYSQRHNPPY